MIYWYFWNILLVFRRLTISKTSNYCLVYYLCQLGITFSLYLRKTKHFLILSFHAPLIMNISLLSFLQDFWKHFWICVIDRWIFIVVLKIKCECVYEWKWFFLSRFIMLIYYSIYALFFNGCHFSMNINPYTTYNKFIRIQ